MHITDWRDDAACRDEDPELFFPLGEEGEVNQQQIAEAKTVCARCPLHARKRCLDFALNNGLDHGVFGGETPSERRGIQERRRTQQLQEAG